MRLVESAPVGETRMQNHAERFADRLVLPTLGLAAAPRRSRRDFNRFLSLVIVDYGTGIRVAAPTVGAGVHDPCGAQGILIKSGAHLEKLAEIDTIVFDKTGTLTHGTPAVLDVVCYQRALHARKMLGLAAAAETRLQHPVAEAIRPRGEAARQINVPAVPGSAVSRRPRREGRINGYYLHLGSERFLRESDQSGRAGRDHRRSERTGLLVRLCSPSMARWRG